MLTAIVNGLRVFSGAVLLAMAAFFAYIALVYEESYDSSNGVDIMMTTFLAIAAIGAAAGGLAFLPLRWERTQTILALVALLAFAALVVLIGAFMT